jgi:hypothetical protein
MQTSKKAHKEVKQDKKIQLVVKKADPYGPTKRPNNPPKKENLANK